MIKSFIDFNSNDELVELIKDYNPDVIGVRAMTFYRNFFHDAIDHVRKKKYINTNNSWWPLSYSFIYRSLKR